MVEHQEGAEEQAVQYGISSLFIVIVETSDERCIVLLYYFIQCIAIYLLTHTHYY